MAVRSDGGDLDARAVKGSGVPLGAVQGQLGLVGDMLVNASGGEARRVTVQLLAEGGRRCPYMEIWTCGVSQKKNM